MSGIEGPGVIGGGGGGAVDWDDIENVPSPVSALGSGSPVNITTNSINMQGQILVARGGAGGVLGAATVNNYVPPNSATENWAIVFPEAGGTTITGLVMETVGNIFDRTFTIENGSGSDDVTLANDSAGSSAGNRFLLPDGVAFVLHPTETITLIYAGNSNWQVYNTGIASDVASAGALTRFKTSDTSRASTTTRTADPQLAFASLPAGTYQVNGVLYFQSASSTPDCTFAIVAGVAPTSGRVSFYVTESGGISTLLSQETNNLITTGTGDAGNSPISGGSASSIVVTFRGWVTLPSAAALSVFWAQAGSDATATVLKQGSWISVEAM